jgi:competence protein ComEC
VAHHGSKNSTSETLLAIVQPKIALISAGRDNGYGHPHDEVLQRLQNVKSRILCTQEKGAITIITDGNSLTFGAIPFRL